MEFSSSPPHPVFLTITGSVREGLNLTSALRDPVAELNTPALVHDSDSTEGVLSSRCHIFYVSGFAGASMNPRAVGAPLVLHAW